MSGYDVQWVAESQIKDFTCTICLSGLKDCVQDKKGHRFCAFCVKDVDRCPLCRGPPTFIPDYATREFMLNLKVICPECKKEITLRYLEDHPGCTNPLKNPSHYISTTPTPIQGPSVRDVGRPSQPVSHTRLNSGKTHGVSKQTFLVKLIPKVANHRLTNAHGWGDLSLSILSESTCRLRWNLHFHTTYHILYFDFYGPPSLEAEPVSVFRCIPRCNGHFQVLRQFLGEEKLSDIEAESLIAGKWYIQVCTDRFPAGELQGKICVNQDPHIPDLNKNQIQQRKR